MSQNYKMMKMAQFVSPQLVKIKWNDYLCKATRQEKSKTITQINQMKRNLLNTTMTLLLLGTSLAAQAIDRRALAEYAQSLKGLKKAELKTAIFNIIKSPKTLRYGSGNRSTWWGFYRTDRIGNTMECRNRYSDVKFYFSGDNGNSIQGMNIEHSFPKSWWGKTKNDAYKDLHHLYPSDAKANSSKSNYPMGIVTSGSSASDGSEKVGMGPGPNGKLIKMFEPSDTYKGDFSRTYMYMATAYQNLTWQGTQGLQELENNSWPTLRQWAYTIYTEWIKNDPVSDIEIERNNAVAAIQGNRNLYIDYPYLAEYVWGDSMDVSFDPYTSITTADNDHRYGNQTAPKVETPIFNPAEGSYMTPINVTIACATEGAKIYYTTDGTQPTAESTPYTLPIDIETTTTLKAVAVLGTDVSKVATAVYTITTAGELQHFKKITTLPTDKRKYLLVVNEAGKLKAAKPVDASAKGYGYLQVANVTEKDNVIEISGGNELIYTLEAANGGFRMKDALGRYYYQDKTFSTFTPTNDPEKADTWLITENGDATFTMKAADSGNVIQYSPKYHSFGNYGSPSAGNLYPMLYESLESAGIDNIDTDSDTVRDAAIYNLNGVRMNSATPLPRGIYIRGGKKFVVK